MVSRNVCFINASVNQITLYKDLFQFRREKTILNLRIAESVWFLLKKGSCTLKLSHLAASIGFGLLAFCAPAYSDENIPTEQVVFGAGPSTVIVMEFFKLFSNIPQAEGFNFSVPPESVKHAGGIRASGEYLFGRTGRPLSEEETSLGKSDIFLGRVPTGFVVGSEVGVSNLTYEELDAILLKEITNWSEVGGKDAEIVIAGREKTEAVLMAMAPQIPALLAAEFDWEFKRDHNLVNFISSPVGQSAIGFGALSNFEGQNIVTIDGMSFGVPLGLVIDDSNLEHPLVTAAQELAASKEWQELLEGLGFAPYP